MTPGLRDATITALVEQAHGCDLYRVWGNAAVNGVVAPIPRLYAAGAALLPTRGDGATTAARSLDRLVHELGDVVVRVQELHDGRAADAASKHADILVRHEDTAVVDQALNRIAREVQAAQSDRVPATMG